MSKGIIVVNIPTGCYGCECCITKEWQSSMNGDHYCGIKERDVSDYWNHEPSLKPDWCPIKPIPKKMLWEETYALPLYALGWNDCINEILKD